MRKFDHNNLIIGFWEKRQIFRWKLPKIMIKTSTMEKNSIGPGANPRYDRELQRQRCKNLKRSE
jgi:hypothetical protein